MKKFIIIQGMISVNMGINEDFVTWLSQEIDSRGWSYSETARRAGVSQSMVSKVLSYANAPGLDFCNGIAKTFNVPAETVLRRAGLLQARPDATPGLRELNFLYEQLDPQAQENILKMMRGYVREVQAGYAKKD